MAENFRSIKEIFEELFEGKDSALAKLAKVERTRYEINVLWVEHGVPLNMIFKPAMAYFSERFLDGKLLEDVNGDMLENGLKKLGYAVESCKKRCTKLVEELNHAMLEHDLEQLQDIQGFLKWTTFYYEDKKDFTGSIIYEPGYDFPVRVFYSDVNRKSFWAETQAIMKTGRIMSVKDITRIVLFKRNHSARL